MPSSFDNRQQNWPLNSKMACVNKNTEYELRSKQIKLKVNDPGSFNP